MHLITFKSPKGSLAGWAWELFLLLREHHEAGGCSAHDLQGLK